MVQRQLNPLSEHGRSGSVLVINPADRKNQVRYLRTARQLRSPEGIRGTPPTYVTPVGSALSTVNPATGPAAGSTGVTLTGTGFGEVEGVTFGGTPATGIIIVSATSITCLTPPHAVGAVDVVVIDAAGNGTLPGGYTYT